ncbi:MAG: septal ring lytic transglycosylase RlpA family protein [Acidisphaera sp.]|nr:septal ring lytic transglycosylase RlpA family protein [Acidisphaera sp.]
MTRRLALLRRRRPAAPLTGLDSVAFDDTGFGDAAASPPADAEVLDQGVASWYGGRRNGMRTSSGTRFNENEMTAAHYWLPLGTRVRVTRDGTDASVLVTITDRQGTGRRAIDLSKAAARRLGILGCGTARVTLTRG